MTTADTGTQRKEYPQVLIFGAKLISYLFHPVFMPLVMAGVLYLVSPNSFTGIPQRELLTWAEIIFYNTIFIPLVAILLMKALGFVKSFRMETAKERIIPLMATMIFYFWVSQVFDRRSDVVVPLVLKVLLLGNLWGIIILFLVNIFTKISMHTASAGGMIGILIVLFITGHVNIAIPFCIALLLAGMIGSARMILHAHERGDIWLGYIIGILVQIGAYLYLK